MKIRTHDRWRRWTAAGAILLAVVSGSILRPAPASAASYVPIAGSGSTWSFNALDAWRKNVAQYGMRIDYAPDGSSVGRTKFRQGVVDFAASDIPYGVKDGTNEDPPPTRGYAYMPDTAGGTTLMYNLKIGNNRVTNLRLSGENIAKIFTGVLTRWNDPAIAKDNPGLNLPAIKIVPVVRSDGSGATAQFTQWMIATEGQYWTAYCGKVGRNPCTQTSAYPVLNGSGMVAQSGDLGVAGYVAQQQAVGTIGYVEYSYAINAGFPVAKMLNAAGYYTEPTAGHVAVSLLKAKINMDASNPATYLTQDLSQVYRDPDPRTYPLSSYSYLVLPTKIELGFNAAKGKTLGDFGNYLLCQGQTQVDSLGYSALPINLVQAGQQQLAKIPGATGTNFTIKNCNNPTFSTNGTNTLANNDPQPAACDKQGPTQCSTGTGGAKTTTPVKVGAQGGNGPQRPTDGASPGQRSGGNATSQPTGPASAGGSGGPSRVVSTGKTSTAATGPTAAGCDPDSGACGDAGGQGNAAEPEAVTGQPVASSASLGDGLHVTLMVLAAALLLGLGLAPPLIAQAARGRRERSARPGEDR